MEAAFAKAGIHDAATLRALGAEAVWQRLIASGYTPHFMAYLALRMGLQDRHFNAPGPDERRNLRAAFEAQNAKATTRPLHGIEAELDRLGVPKSNT